MKIKKAKRVLSLLQASCLALLCLNSSAYADEACEVLTAPAESFQSQPASIAPRISSANSWRAIDTLVILPKEFSTDPDTGLPLALSQEELKTQARLSIAQANIHLRPLQVFINIVDIKVYSDAASDPFTPAASRRNAQDMLQTAVSLYNSFTIERDFTLVLGSGYFRGTYGLAYSSVSCESPSYSVAFATKGGSANRLKFMLGHTIAHETGHFLGMGHDYDTHNHGISVMAPRPATHEFGFSSTSIARAQSRIAPGLVGGSCFANVAKPGFANDGDFDSIPDIAESTAGTSATDAGSYPLTLNNLVHAPWNSFLSAMNIVELINPSEDITEVELTLLSQHGVELKRLYILLEGGEQKDIILNNLVEFPLDSYGLVRIEFVGVLDGRIAFYRTDKNSSYEFAYAIALLNPLSDVTNVSFNTFQPSLAANEANYSVSNWLTLINLSDVAASFRVFSFDQIGSVIKSRDIILAPMSRVDIDGGHGFAGASRVGLHKIIPADPATKYLSFLTRYGSNATAQSLATEYFYAFPLLAQAGTGESTSLAVSASQRLDNWIELSNTTGGISIVDLEIFADDGLRIFNTTVEVAALNQYHFNAAAILKAAGVSVGSVAVNARNDGRVLAHSMTYMRSLTGSMDAMYGLSSQEAQKQTISGSFNLYLLAQNVIRLHNTANDTVEVTLTLSASSGVHEHSYTLDPLQTLVLDAHELGAFSNTYGVVKARASKDDAIVGSILRIAQQDQNVSLAIPTTLR